MTAPLAFITGASSGLGQALAARYAQAGWRLALVALKFPKWVDGRAYSQAVVLRGRMKFGGEIIATGEVMLDMLPLLRRCGFDAAQLAGGQDPAAADRALGFFPGHYQAAPHRSVRA